LTLSKVLLAGSAAVASEHPLASLAGYDVLRGGGNAFDAAVATSFTLAVTSHHIGGLGGDFFAMLYEARTGKVHCLNSSGWAPSGLTLDLIASKGGSIPTYGPLSCVIPGQTAGVCEAHRKFGSVEFSKLLAPAAGYAAKGFPASEGLSRSLSLAWEQFSPEARSAFSRDGTPPAPGAWIRQEALARTIGEIAKGGAEAFYLGEPAHEIQETLQRLGVPCAASDFRDFAPEWVRPLSLDYKGNTVFETPPNSMGATSLLMLKILSGRDLANDGPLSGARVAATMDAAQTAYDRKDRYLGDPRFEKVDLEAFMDISPAPSTYSGRVADGDTTAFSIADSEGNVVSAIQSLFHHFGSRVFVPGCGVMLNDRAAGFRTEGPNRVEPRKRPLHTLSSLIIETKGGGRIGIGTSGGDYRPLQHALFVTNLVDYRMRLEHAVDHPRFLWSEGRELLVEEGYETPPGTGYDVKMQPMPGHTGVCHAVETGDRLRKAVCDVRGDGAPAGF
jgi:gamma-glutamyltranspeptidase/glutathione hydrolase